VPQRGDELEENEQNHDELEQGAPSRFDLAFDEAVSEAPKTPLVTET